MEELIDDQTMESLAICIDNTVDLHNNPDMTFGQFFSQLKQQIITSEIICHQLISKNSENNVSIVTFSGETGANKLMDLTNNTNRIKKSLMNVRLEEDFDFMTGLMLASYQLEVSHHPIKRLVVFITSRIQCTDKEIFSRSKECFEKLPKVSILIISFGPKILRNRHKFEVIKRSFDNDYQKTIDVTEIREFNAKDFLYQMFASNPESDAQEMRALFDFIDRSEGLSDLNSNISTDYNRQVEELEIERNNLINDKDMDEASKAVVIQLLEQNMRDIKLNANGTQIETNSNLKTKEELDLEKAIELSLKENYSKGNESSVKTNAFTISLKSKQKKKVKKFKEGVKDD